MLHRFLAMKRQRSPKDLRRLQSLNWYILISPYSKPFWVILTLLLLFSKGFHYSRDLVTCTASRIQGSRSLLEQNPGIWSIQKCLIAVFLHSVSNAYSFSRLFWFISNNDTDEALSYISSPADRRCHMIGCTPDQQRHRAEQHVTLPKTCLFVLINIFIYKTVRICLL